MENFSDKLMPRLIEFQDHIFDANHVIAISGNDCFNLITVLTTGGKLTMSVSGTDEDRVIRQVQELRSKVWPEVKTDVELEEDEPCAPT